EGIPHPGIEPVESLGQLSGAHPNSDRTHPVETLSVIEECGRATLAHLPDQVGRGSTRTGDITLGAGNHRAQLGIVEGATTKVKSADHHPQVYVRRRRALATPPPTSVTPTATPRSSGPAATSARRTGPPRCAPSTAAQTRAPTNH